MPRIQEKICAVLGAFSSTPASRSGTIEQILSFNTIHRIQEPAKPCTDSILAQSPVSAQYNRGLFGATFAAINPQSTVSAQANRGFFAVGFETAIGGAV